MSRTEIVDTNSLSLADFLSIISLPNAEKKYYPFYRFPSENLLDDFLTDIHIREEVEIKNVLRHLLPKSGTYGSDLRAKFFYKKSAQKSVIYEETEYFKRLKALKNPKYDQVWEGLSWILDLLPDSPHEAVRVIDAYFSSNISFMPEDMIFGLTDCISIIRTRYLDKEHPREIFLNLFPKDFEKLVAQTYFKMGFEVKLTKASRDGGIDVHATKDQPGKKEKLVIQCKRYSGKITLDDVKVLHSTTLSNKATKGVYVTSSEYTRDAKRYAQENPSIELIDNKQLSKLLNKIFGSNWSSKISIIINNRL